MPKGAKGGERMDAGEQTIGRVGTRDEHYDLTSVLYHALHGAENCEMYVTDAAATGDADPLVLGLISTLTLYSVRVKRA